MEDISIANITRPPSCYHDFPNTQFRVGRPRSWNLEICLDRKTKAWISDLKQAHFPATKKKKNGHRHVLMSLIIRVRECASSNTCILVFLALHGFWKFPEKNHISVTFRVLLILAFWSKILSRRVSGVQREGAKGSAAAGILLSSTWEMDILTQT